MEPTILTRRHFIQMAAIASGGVLLLPGCANQAIKSSWRFFTENEAKLMDAIAEQIIPTDEWPGGKEAGVTNFVDKQLVGPYERHQETYRTGMMNIQQNCEAVHHKQFEALDWDVQTHFLEAMEAGKSDRKYWEEGFDKKFFGMLRNHSMQGFYGSPRHGGNKDNVSYQMLKLDYPVIIGQNRYNN